METTVLLIRHGRTAFNREGVFRGRFDVPFDEVGRRQAAAVARILAGHTLAALYSSPLSRAGETARAIASLQGLTVSREEAFNNLELGPWTGRPRTEVAREQPELWALWNERPEELRLEGAETLDQVADRSMARLGELVETHAGSTFAVVSHRAVLKPLLARALGLAAPWFWRFALEPGSITTLEHRPGRGYTLVRLNETAHLEGKPGSTDDA